MRVVRGEMCEDGGCGKGGEEGWFGKVSTDQGPGSLSRGGNL